MNHSARWSAILLVLFPAIALVAISTADLEGRGLIPPVKLSKKWASASEAPLLIAGDDL